MLSIPGLVSVSAREAKATGLHSTPCFWSRPRTLPSPYYRLKHVHWFLCPCPGCIRQELSNITFWKASPCIGVHSRACFGLKSPRNGWDIFGENLLSWLTTPINLLNLVTEEGAWGHLSSWYLEWLHYYQWGGPGKLYGTDEIYICSHWVSSPHSGVSPTLHAVSCHVSPDFPQKYQDIGKQLVHVFLKMLRCTRQFIETKLPCWGNECHKYSLDSGVTLFVSSLLNTLTPWLRLGQVCNQLLVLKGCS